MAKNPKIFKTITEKLRKKLMGPVLGVIILVSFIALYVILDYISLNDKGPYFDLEKGLQIAAVIIATLVIIRWFKFILTQSYAEKKAALPNIIITLFNIAVVFISALFITTEILDKDAITLIAAFSVLGAGIAFATQGLVLDAFAGVFLDMARTHKIGDWIKLSKGDMGAVTDITWRSTHLLTAENTTLVVPNGQLVKDGYINYSTPGNVYFDTVVIGIDHDVPIDRIERIMHGAILTIPEIADHGVCDTLAITAASGGIDFCLRYPVPHVPQWRLMRHKVLETAIRHLHEAGFKVSEGLGEYALSRAGDLVMASELTAEELLQRISLFNSLSEDERAKFAKKLKKHFFRKGEVVIKQGSTAKTMFMIGEGAVDIIREEKVKGKLCDVFLASLGGSNYFGEMSLLTGEGRNATVKAKTDVVLFEVSKSDLSLLFKLRPKLVEEMAALVAIRQVSTSQIIADTKKHAKEVSKTSNKILSGIKKFFGL